MSTILAFKARSRWTYITRDEHSCRYSTAPLVDEHETGLRAFFVDGLGERSELEVARYAAGRSIVWPSLAALKADVGGPVERRPDLDA